VKLGWTVEQVFVDDDISAYSGKKRPAYRAMLDLLDQGSATGVIVWHTDRLHRSPRELEEYIDVCERRGVITQAVQSGELDLSTPSGRAVARTLGAWARFESEHKSERVKRASRQAADEGRWTGGTRPFGWQIIDGVPTIDQAEAALVKDASSRLLAGESMGSVVRLFNASSTSTMGKAWNYSTLRQVMKRARNAGLSSWHGEILGASQFPALVTEDAWRAVVSLLDNPARRRSQSNRARWLLAGIAQCECGETVKSGAAGTRSGINQPIYRCRVSGPGHVARRAADIDDEVTKTMVGILSRPDALAHLSVSSVNDSAELQAEAVTLRARLTESADSAADGNITVAQLERITARVTARLSVVESGLASSMGKSVLSGLVGPDAATLWAVAPIDRKRAVVDLLATVTIMKVPRGMGRVFNPDTVRIEPKQSTQSARGSRQKADRGER
jgi:site-specific DNA recombinase